MLRQENTTGSVGWQIACRICKDVGSVTLTDHRGRQFRYCGCYLRLMQTAPEDDSREDG